MFKLGQPTPDITYGIHHPLDLKMLTRLRLGLSHHNKHRFKHNLKNCINPLCACALKVDSIKHYYSALRISFLNYLNNISPQFALLPEDVFVKILIYDNQTFDENQNQEILETSI